MPARWEMPFRTNWPKPDHFGLSMSTTLPSPAALSRKQFFAAPGRASLLCQRHDWRGCDQVTYFPLIRDCSRTAPTASGPPRLRSKEEPCGRDRPNEL